MPGKSRGRHPHKALTDKFIRSNLTAGRYADGNGLYLLVDKSGNRRWVLRTQNKATGKRCDIGLGGLSTVTLKEARESALEWRKVARSGVDPMQERRKARKSIPTFETAANIVHQERSSGWKNPKHAAQWINTLQTYAFPVLGEMQVSEITSPDVRAVLSPIWLAKPETARRVRQRIGTVLDWAKAEGHRSGDNPVTGVSRGLPPQPKGQKHFAALPYAEIPGFIVELRDSKSALVTKLALEFLALTATRTGEVRLAEWSEFNIEGRTWTIPAERTKSGREFRVPLSSRCVELLTLAQEISGGDGYVFPGQKSNKPLSNTVFLQVLKRMGKTCTGHGFRSTFRDWAGEKTNFPNEVCEMALAHTIGDKTEAAYRRGDLFEKRRELMDTWSRYATTDPHSKIVILRATDTA